MAEGRLERASRQQIDTLLREHWSLPIVSVDRQYMPGDLEGLTWINKTGAAQGLITWVVSGDRAEIVTVDAFT